MASSHSISIPQARDIVLRHQLFKGSGSPENGEPDILDVFQRLGYVQIDTIAVIERAHHHTLWNRLAGYEAARLHALQTEEKAVFEYWAHAMSYLPMTDFRFYLPRMQNFREPSSPWARYQFEKAGHLLNPVLERVRNEGPLSAKDFKTEKRTGASWWDWKPAKVALELLFWRGDLMISGRRNFQKVYDLTERVLPSDTDTTMPDAYETVRFLINRALKAMGIAREREIIRFLQPGSSRDADMQLVPAKTIRQALIDMEAENAVVRFRIDDLDEPAYALKNTLEKTDVSPGNAAMCYLLSPFDNLIIQRERVRWLFDFDYSLECYVPGPKRRYGYFVLPILYRNRFAGRLDPSADRKSATLIVRRLQLESGFTLTDAFCRSLADALRQFAAFNASDTIRFEESDTNLVGRLQSLL